MTIFLVILRLLEFFFGIFFSPLSGFLILIIFLYSFSTAPVCVCKCLCVAETVRGEGVRRLDTFGKTNRVIITVKDSVVGANEDISQDPERAPRWWDIQAGKPTQADGLSLCRNLEKSKNFSQRSLHLLNLTDLQIVSANPS